MPNWTLDSNWADIETALNAAKRLFLARDSWLLEADVNERSMTHKFAEYLQPIFKPWNVDCEYNRDGLDDPKTLPLEEWRRNIRPNDSDSVYPDIIVHRRNSGDNLIVIEAKKPNGDLRQETAKVRAYLNPNGLAYRIGVLLQFITGIDGDVVFQQIKMTGGV